MSRQIMDERRGATVWNHPTRISLVVTKPLEKYLSWF